MASATFPWKTPFSLKRAAVEFRELSLKKRLTFPVSSTRKLFEWNGTLNWLFVKNLLVTNLGTNDVYTGMDWRIGENRWNAGSADHRNGSLFAVSFHISAHDFDGKRYRISKIDLIDLFWVQWFFMYLGGAFKGFLFSLPYLGNDPNWQIFFQMGWFNYQLDMISKYVKIRRFAGDWPTFYQDDLRMVCLWFFSPSHCECEWTSSVYLRLVWQPVHFSITKNQSTISGTVTTNWGADRTRGTTTTTTTTTTVIGFVSIFVPRIPMLIRFVQIRTVMRFEQFWSWRFGKLRKLYLATSGEG